MSNTTTINLQAFCGEGLSRYQLAEPFHLGGYTYATDSRICIRVKTDRADTIEDGGNVRKTIPSVATLFPKSPDCKWEWPEINMSRAIGKCPTCKGIGKETCECCGCQTMECDECAGSGTIETWATTQVGNHQIKQKYCELIAALPGVKRAGGMDPRKPLCFAFDGGEGLVMGVDPEAK